LATVIVVVASAVGICIALWIVSVYRQRKILQEVKQWLLVEAKVESGAIETTSETNKVVLPTFAFSYQVPGEYYSGRFGLMPKRFLGEELIQSMIDRMIGRKFLIRYDPSHPEAWFIPDESIDGCKVEQRISSNVIHRYYPRD